MNSPDSGIEPMETTLAQQFELDKMIRTIDACRNIDDLKKTAKLLAQAWMNQRAATAWAMRQSLPEPPWAAKVREPALDGDSPEAL